MNSPNNANSFNNKINTIYSQLHTTMGDRHWWPASSVYEMMVGAVLVQNTAWNNVDLALKNFGDNLNPEFVETCDIDELALIIRPSGFHNQKAKKLKALTKWFKHYDYNIEKAKLIDSTTIRNELLAIHGVGFETADCIMVYALDKPSFVVDAYARRILERNGCTLPKKYEDLRLLIEESIPKDLYVYKEYHALLVEHCQEFCSKKNPSCAHCPLVKDCEFGYQYPNT